MKDESFIDKSIRYIVHNSFLITVAFMGFVHFILMLVMLCTGVVPLVHFNVLSVVIYLFCVVLCAFGHIMPVYVSIFLEVSAYTIVSIYCIGWSCGSCCFLCSIVPIIIYFGSFLFQRKQRWIIVILLVVNFALYVFLYIRFSDVQPVYTVPVFARNLLIIFSSFVMVFSMIFYNAMYIYSSEYEMYNLERKNRQLSADARKDELTSLLNRRGFLPVIENLMKDDRAHFCVAFCDIDNFKRINDSFGHECGDEVLRHITRVMKREMHGCDICRWGGEEIIILMNEYSFDEAKNKLETLRKDIEANPTVFFNKRVYATITIGLENYSTEYHEPEDIIKIADEKMYYGKQHGKNILITEIESNDD